MTLRSKLIRLAHENPALRKDILPLLRSKTAAEAPTVKEIVRLGRSPIKADRTSYEKMMIRLWDRKGRDSFSYNPAGGEADDVDLLDVKDAIELPKVSGVGRVAVVKKSYGGTTIEVGRREGYYWRWYVLLKDS